MKSDKVYVRVNVTMDSETLDRINAYTERTHLSRSRVVCESVNQYLSAMEALPTLTEQVDELKSLLEQLASMNNGAEKTPAV